MTAPKVLVACIGNIFLGDDGFGVEVARQLSSRPQPEGVRVVDFGIRGLDLTYCLLEEFSAVILVDAVPRGDTPGTLYLIEPDLSSLGSPPQEDAMIDAHGMHPEKVLRAAVSMGANLRRVLLVGCEPTPFDPEKDVEMDLSPPVRAAVDGAISMIDSIVAEILQNERQLAGAGAPSDSPPQTAGQELYDEAHN